MIESDMEAILAKLAVDLPAAYTAAYNSPTETLIVKSISTRELTLTVGSTDPRFPWSNDVLVKYDPLIAVDGFIIESRDPTNPKLIIVGASLGGVVFGLTQI